MMLWWRAPPVLTLAIMCRCVATSIICCGTRPGLLRARTSLQVWVVVVAMAVAVWYAVWVDTVCTVVVGVDLFHQSVMRSHSFEQRVMQSWQPSDLHSLQSLRNDTALCRPDVPCGIPWDPSVCTHATMSSSHACHSLRSACNLCAVSQSGLLGLCMYVRTYGTYSQVGGSRLLCTIAPFIPHQVGIHCFPKMIPFPHFVTSLINKCVCVCVCACLCV